MPYRVRVAFDSIDEDKSGYLDEREIFMALRRYGIHASKNPSMMLRVREEAGTDRLDFRQFTVLVAKLEEEKRLSKQLHHFSASLTPRPPFAPRFL